MDIYELKCNITPYRLSTAMYMQELIGASSFARLISPTMCRLSLNGIVAQCYVVISIPEIADLVVKR